MRHIVESYEYNTFGKLTIKDASGNTITQPNYNNPYASTARRYDPNRVYYYRNRYYDPSLVRFISKDPKGYVDGYKLYAYVKNNPLKYTDPFGTQSTAKWNNLYDRVYNNHGFDSDGYDYYGNPVSTGSDASYLERHFNHEPSATTSPNSTDISNNYQHLATATSSFTSDYITNQQLLKLPSTTTGSTSISASIASPSPTSMVKRPTAEQSVPVTSYNTKEVGSSQDGAKSGSFCAFV